MILLVSNRQDLGADFLISRLIERDVPYFRLNSDEIRHIDLEVSPVSGKGVLFTGHKELKLHDVSAVWYRRSITPSLADDIDLEYRHFCRTELKHLYEGVLLSLPAKWINGIHDTDMAERKVYQIRVASDVGLEVPNSCISSQSSVIRRFMQPGLQYICKPVSNGLVTTPQNDYSIYTRIVSLEEFEDDITFPVFVQQRVMKASDIRVSIVGSRMFSAEITSVDPESSVDWRMQASEVAYREITLPPEIERSLLSLMRRLRLHFGAVDLVRTIDDKWYFLEVNPAGEWAWLEQELGFKIRDALIDEFGFSGR